MEIERKWLVNGWPNDALKLQVIQEHQMEQGYISTVPTVRLRKEALIGGKTEYILCFKAGSGLTREEIEMPLAQTLFDDLAQKILAKPMIPKLRRSYALPGGLTLEVNEVDKGQATAFYYAEIEFETEAEARAWQPAHAEQCKCAHLAQTKQSTHKESIAQTVQPINGQVQPLDLSAYLSNEVTYQKGQSMAEYWQTTRG